MAAIKDLSISDKASTLPTLPTTTMSIPPQRPHERRKQLVRLVARTLMWHLLQPRQQRQRRRQHRQVIHPGGVLVALRHIALVLKGSPKQFQRLIRLTKPQFWRLLDWLETNAGLVDTQYQTSAQKLLVFLWICASAKT